MIEKEKEITKIEAFVYKPPFYMLVKYSPMYTYTFVYSKTALCTGFQH